MGVPDTSDSPKQLVVVTGWEIYIHKKLYYKGKDDVFPGPVTVHFLGECRKAVVGGGVSVCGTGFIGRAEPCRRHVSGSSWLRLPQAAPLCSRPSHAVFPPVTLNRMMVNIAQHKTLLVKTGLKNRSVRKYYSLLEPCGMIYAALKFSILFLLVFFFPFQTNSQSFH